PGTTVESTRRWAVTTGHGSPKSPQSANGGTLHVIVSPSLVPPLSASMNVAPAGIGSVTATGGITGSPGHCGGPCPFGAVHGRPKFGPALQMPFGFWRQNPFTGIGGMPLPQYVPAL